VLIRADAHARYPAGFATGLARTLDHEQADSVVVPLLAIGAAAPWQAAASALQSSWLGHGGASHRQKQGSGWTDHGHHAAFRLSAFLAIDGYDTRFRANEDAEFDARLRAAGGRIYLQSRWPVGYLPRNGPRAIWRQYLRNGRWRGETILQHGQMRLRQLLPCGVTVMVGITPALVLVDPIGALPALGYLAGVLGASIRVGGRHWARVGCLAVLSHLGFGTGLLVTLLRAAFRPRMGTAHP
jgi:succinoglycan biosynthesis protein ExoA